MLLLLSKASKQAALKLVIEKQTRSLLVYLQGVRAASWPEVARSSASARTSVAASDCLVSSMGYLVTKPLLVRETWQRSPLMSSFQNQMHHPPPKKRTYFAWLQRWSWTCLCRGGVLWQPVPCRLWPPVGIPQQWPHVSLRHWPQANAQDHGRTQGWHVSATLMAQYQSIDVDLYEVPSSPPVLRENNLVFNKVVFLCCELRWK